MKSSVKLSLDPKYAVFHSYFASTSTNQRSSDVTLDCEDGLYFDQVLKMSTVKIESSLILSCNNLNLYCSCFI